MVIPGVILPLPAISQPVLGPCSGVSKKAGPVLTGNVGKAILCGSGNGHGLVYGV